METLGELFAAWWGERVQLVRSSRTEVADLERDFQVWREDTRRRYLYVKTSRFLDWVKVQNLQTFRARGMTFVDGCRLVPPPLPDTAPEAAITCGEGHAPPLPPPTPLPRDDMRNARELVGAHDADPVDHDLHRWGDEGGR